MNLDDIPMGNLGVKDTNAPRYAEPGLSAQAQRLRRHRSKGGLIGTLLQTVWPELTHKLMLADAMMKGMASGGNPAARLTDKPTVVRGLSLYQANARSLLDLGPRFERCTLDDLFRERNIRKEQLRLTASRRAHSSCR